MKKIILLGVLFCYANSGMANNTRELSVASPDGKLVLRFWQKPIKDGIRQLVYGVSCNGKKVLNESQAGLQLDNKVWEHALAKNFVQPQCWMDNFEVDSVSYSSFKETWSPLVGERSII